MKHVWLSDESVTDFKVLPLPNYDENIQTKKKINEKKWMNRKRNHFEWIQHELQTHKNTIQLNTKRKILRTLQLIDI